MSDSAPPKERRHFYWDLFDFSQGRGLEIGPLHRTIVPRAEADVHYVDVHDQAGLRSHYDGDPAVDPALIPEIDYALIQPDGRTLSLVEATAAGAPFAWVMASHVIEHVPDVIGWLAEIAEIAEDDARLVLAIPDRRYCFDVLRPATSVGQMIQAHDDGDNRPSVRAVYDYFSKVAQGTAVDLWSGHLPTYADHYHSLDEADAKVVETSAGTYVDCHVWLFTPNSFVEQMHELRSRGRSSWIVETIESTPLHDLEFKAVMRRIPRDTDPSQPQPDEVVPSLTRPEWLTSSTDHVRALTDRVAFLEDRLGQRRDKLRAIRGKSRARAKRDQATIASLRSELARVHESWQWMIGRAVLAPARAARRGLGS